MDNCNPDPATPDAATLRNLEPNPWRLGDAATRPLRAAGAVWDVAECGGCTRMADLGSSVLLTPEFRVFILAHRQDAVPDPVGDGRIPWRRESGSSASASGDNRALAPGHRPRSQRTAWLGEQIRRPRDAVVADRGHLLRWGRYADAPIARWEHITGLPAPAPILLSESAGPRTSPEFVEWLMGLPTGWITGADCGLTTS